MADKKNFSKQFAALTGFEPMPWQEALYARFTAGSGSDIPSCCDIPTGLGKTSVIAIWLIALANYPDKMPRRLVYVVNRRTVVDQTTDEVEKLRRNLEKESKLTTDLRKRLGLLAISTLRGQFADNKEWSADPSRPAVICGTVDMIGSRLLFSGYRIGFKSKPLHAGFLGQDVLLVHDEAHLEPAFQRLIKTIEIEQAEKGRGEDMPWPKLQVMALSATVRSDEENSESIVRLTDKDRKHALVKKRIHAAKHLKFHLCDDDKELVKQLVSIALEHKESGVSVLLFARSVAHVESVAQKLARTLKKAKLPEYVATLTGTMRGYERDKLVRENAIFARFLPEAEAEESTAYLVCTSAGEVGVNISADHMVCDLSTFDSMAQRFGRVNRFGDCKDTQIDVVHPNTFGGKGTNAEVEARREKTLKLLQQLNGDASPAALENLDAKARHEAFAPEPVILPATDILFDAWSLTTIRDKMPGRPPVEPYLHGVSEWEPPQTQVAWREEVEIITGDLLDRYKPQDLLEAYPLKPHELLRDRSDRVFKHLETIANKYPDIPAWLIEERNLVTVLSLKELVDKKKRDQINGKIVLLSPKVGGLRKGLLDSKTDSADDVADQWLESKKAKEGEEQIVQRRSRLWDDTQPPDDMALIRTIDINSNAGEFDSADEEDNESSEGSNKKRFWHWYVRPHDAEDALHASTEPISWKHHTDDVVTRTTNIVKGLGLPDELQQAIILAAEFHDIGKMRELWQRSIGHSLPENPKLTDWLAKSGSNKTRPGFRTDYRHEFGSLLDILDSEQPHFAEFNKLSDDMQELVLHLIAAHHGYARPHFPTERSIDPERPQSQADEQALETPRRFARLQRKYGRWGLAYVESLLRAADWAASAEPSPLPSKTEENNA